MSAVHLRLASRIRTGLRVDWNIVGRRAHVVSSIDDMSAGGAFVRTACPAPQGSQVSMSLLTDGGVVPTLARVVRCDEHGMGVRFETSDPEDVPFDIRLDDVDDE
jgi:hypothetical protein